MKIRKELHDILTIFCILSNITAHMVYYSKITLKKYFCLLDLGSSWDFFVLLLQIHKMFDANLVLSKTKIKHLNPL